EAAVSALDGVVQLFVAPFFLAKNLATVFGHKGFVARQSFVVVGFGKIAARDDGEIVLSILCLISLLALHRSSKRSQRSYKQALILQSQSPWTDVILSLGSSFEDAFDPVQR